MPRYFGIDLKTLAASRVLLAAILIYDIVSRLFMLEIFHTDAGVFPRELARTTLPINWIPSLHLLNGSWEFQGLLLVLHGVLALALLLGWRTRVVTVLCWYLTLSLHFRNEAILNGGDYVLRGLLFWGMFLPWGARYSLDERRSGSLRAQVVGSIATAGWYLQVCLLYWGAAMTKNGPVWNKDFTAMYYALHLDGFVSPVGVWLRDYTGILKFATGYAYYIEWLAPILLLVGKKKPRILGVVLLGTLHIGIGITMQVGAFWIIPLVGLLALLPSNLSSEEEKEEQSLHPALSVALGAIIFLLPYLNLTQVHPQKLPLALPIYTTARTLGFHYGWTMFARPNDNLDGWYLFEANLSNDTTIDLLTGAAITTQKPATGSMYKNQRWRRFMADIYHREHREQGTQLAKFLARKWNEKHDTAVRQVRVHYVAEETPYPPAPAEPQDRVLIEVSSF